MEEKTITILSTQNLHARLAAQVVKTATNYDVDITLEYKDQIVDLKSLLGFMSLAIPKGANVIVRAKGRQAEAAIKEISKIMG